MLNLGQLTSLDLTGWDYDEYGGSVSLHFVGDVTLYVTPADGRTLNFNIQGSLEE